jgi:hypothetical protein
MNISISDEVLSKWGLSIQEFLFLLFSVKEGDINECISSLIRKGWVDKNLFDARKVVISNNRKEDIATILVDSEKVETKLEFEELADKLREIFPKGKKPGTTYMWRDTTAVIAKKLKILVTKYNCKFTEEQAIKATQAYVNSFGGNYKYMQLLKYFILKTPTNASGDVELRSDFMSYVDNEGHEEQLREDWMSNMV